MLQRVTRTKRRILMTVDAVGGVWQYALGLAEQLVRQGDVVFLAGVGPWPTSEQLEQARLFASVDWLRTPLDWIAGSAQDLAGLSGELVSLVRNYDIDLVQLNAPTQAAGLDLPCPVVVVSHSCVVTWFHAVRGTLPEDGWAWHKQCNAAGFAQADVVVAPSESHAAALRACYGPMPGLAVVHNSVHSAPIAADRENFVSAAARWWDEGKNGNVLDLAAARTDWPVHAAGPTASVSGDGIEFRHVKSVGAISNIETRRLMARSEMFVSPSLYEPFGLAALEAAMAGTPLVLADIPTYRELWADAALFFAPRDADALANALNHLAANPAERRELGAAALQRAGRYAPERQADAMRAVHDEAASIHAGGV